jgi:hypothetical protein
MADMQKKKVAATSKRIEILFVKMKMPKKENEPTTIETRRQIVTIAIVTPGASETKYGQKGSSRR